MAMSASVGVSTSSGLQLSAGGTLDINGSGIKFEGGANVPPSSPTPVALFTASMSAIPYGNAPALSWLEHTRGQLSVQSSRADGELLFPASSGALTIASAWGSDPARRDAPYISLVLTPTNLSTGLLANFPRIRANMTSALPAPIPLPPLPLPLPPPPPPPLPSPTPNVGRVAIRDFATADCTGLSTRDAAYLNQPTAAHGACRVMSDVTYTASVRGEYCKMSASPARLVGAFHMGTANCTGAGIAYNFIADGQTCVTHPDNTSSIVHCTQDFDANVVGTDIAMAAVGATSAVTASSASPSPLGLVFGVDIAAATVGALISLAATMPSGAAANYAPMMAYLCSGVLMADHLLPAIGAVSASSLYEYALSAEVADGLSDAPGDRMSSSFRRVQPVCGPVAAPGQSAPSCPPVRSITTASIVQAQERGGRTFPIGLTTTSDMNAYTEVLVQLATKTASILQDVTSTISPPPLPPLVTPSPPPLLPLPPHPPYPPRSPPELPSPSVSPTSRPPPISPPTAPATSSPQPAPGGMYRLKTFGTDATCNPSSTQHLTVNLPARSTDHALTRCSQPHILPQAMGQSAALFIGIVHSGSAYHVCMRCERAIPSS